MVRFLDRFNNVYFNEFNEVKCDLKNINIIKNFVKVINIEFLY